MKEIKHFQQLNGAGDGVTKNKLVNWIIDGTCDVTGITGVKSIDAFALSQNILTLKFTDNTNTQQSKTVDLSPFAADVNVQNAALQNPSTGVYNLVITETDGSVFTIDLSSLLKVSVVNSTYITLAGDGTPGNPLKASADPSLLLASSHGFTPGTTGLSSTNVQTAIAELAARTAAASGTATLPEFEVGVGDSTNKLSGDTHFRYNPDACIVSVQDNGFATIDPTGNIFQKPFDSLGSSAVGIAVGTNNDKRNATNFALFGTMNSVNNDNAFAHGMGAQAIHGGQYSHGNGFSTMTNNGTYVSQFTRQVFPDIYNEAKVGVDAAVGSLVLTMYDHHSMTFRATYIDEFGGSAIVEGSVSSGTGTNSGLRIFSTQKDGVVLTDVQVTFATSNGTLAFRTECSLSAAGTPALTSRKITGTWVIEATEMHPIQ